MSSSVDSSAQGFRAHSRRYGPCGYIALLIWSRQLDTEFDRLAQARGNEIGSRAIPQPFQAADVDVLHPAAQDDGRLR